MGRLLTPSPLSAAPLPLFPGRPQISRGSFAMKTSLPWAAGVLSVPENILGASHVHSKARGGAGSVRVAPPCTTPGTPGVRTVQPHPLRLRALPGSPQPALSSGVSFPLSPGGRWTEAGHFPAADPTSLPLAVPAVTVLVARPHCPPVPPLSSPSGCCCAGGALAFLGYF